MKKILLMAGAGLMAAAYVSADTVGSAERIEWLANVTEGYYNDPANWTGGVVPQNGIDGKYGYINFQNADMTIKVPEEGLVDNSGTIFLGNGTQKHTLTIDTRGTFWEKRGLKSKNDWWGSPFAYNLNGGHVFNFETLNKNDNNELVWKFTDALFTWESVNNNQRFDLISGTLNFNKQLFLGSVGGDVNFYIHPEATLTSTGTFQQRGNGNTHTTFLGGRHSLYYVYLKDANSSTGTTYMHLTNDAVLAVSEALHVAGRQAGGTEGKVTAILDLANESRVEVTNSVYLGAGASSTYHLRNQGILELRDNASFYSKNAFYCGYSQSSTGLVTMVANTSLRNDNHVYLGFSSNSVGRVELSDDAVMTCNALYRMAHGKESQAYTTLRDRAKLSVGMATGNWLVISPNTDGAYSHLEMHDDSIIELENRASIEMTMGGTSRAELLLDGRAKLLGGYTSGITNKSDIVGNTSISIADDALLSVYLIAGNSPANDTPAMTFNANGGTVAPSAVQNEGNIFMRGCVATLGARGLTLDAKNINIKIEQAFATAEGADEATITKTGVGNLTILADSDHPRTVVTEGALIFANGAKTFGKSLVLGQNAYLAVADAASAIEVDSLSFEGMLAIDIPSDYSIDEEHTLITIAEGLTPEQFAKVVVRSPAKGKKYALSQSGDGKSVTVTVTASAEAEAYTWNAASGNWSVAENWTPVGVPSHNDSATIASGAAITIDASSMVGTIDVVTTSPATIAGGADLYVADAVSVAEGGELEVSASLRNASAVEKSGPGTLKVSGANDETLSGNIVLNGGVTEFATPESLGMDSANDGGLTISNCTFRYTGETEAVIKRPLRIGGEFCSTLDVVGDLTFDNARVSYAPTADNRGGGIVKTGAGTLTLNVPAGTLALSVRDAEGRRSNVDVAGIYAPHNGQVTSWEGMGQFSVLDGKVVIQGKGKDVSIVRQEHHSSIGGSGYKSQVAPELHLKDVSFYSGSGNGFHMLIDQQTEKGSQGAKLILENSYMEANGLYLGYNKKSGNGETVRPVLAITNSTLNITWNFSAPNAGGIEPIVRIGQGGVLQRNYTSAAGGMNFNHKLNVRVEDGGMIDVRSPQNLFLNSGSNGDFVFANGGGMKVHRFLANSGNAFNVVFDGGYAQFTLNEGISVSSYCQKSCFRADAGGGELRVDAGVSHALAVALRGEGMFTKTGAGTLVITNDITWSMSNNLPVYNASANRYVKIENEGGVRIDAGKLVCVEGTTSEASHFSGTGTLSGVFDVLRIDADAEATKGLTLENVTASKVVLDFGRSSKNPVMSGTEAVVAKLAPGMSFNDFSWRAINLGDGKSAELKCDDEGNVTAAFKSTGMAIIIR